MKFPQCETCANKHMMKCDNCYLVCYLAGNLPINYQEYSSCDSTSVQSDTQKMMPERLEKIISKTMFEQKIFNPDFMRVFQQGFNACYESLMQNSKVVEIPNSCAECRFSVFDYKYMTNYCRLHDKQFEILDKYPARKFQAEFCKAKRAIIILDGE